MADNIVEKINNYLLESESFANEFLPLKETLMPIQQDFQSALSELKQKSESAEDLADKVFYINRYTDLVKKVEGVFDTRSKRLQQTLTMLAKLPPVATDTVADVSQTDEEQETNAKLTPEQANEILKILNQTKQGQE